MLPRLGKNVPPSERRPIAWYAPPVLWQAGRELVSSQDFQRNSDRREGFAGPLEVVDLRAETSGFDFIADTGDGGNATFTVAAAASRATLATAGGPSFDRPRLVVLGGDLSYPAASSHDYHYRFLEVFSLAAPGSSDAPEPRAWPHVLSIPQNHDWFDSATTFCRHFVGRSRPSDLLGARTHQSRTYFAALLPHRWWILGLDFAHKGDIDRAQYEAFVSLFACQSADAADGPPRPRMLPGDKVILVYPKPYWTEPLSQGTPEGYTLRYQRLEYWLEARHDVTTHGQVGAGARIRLRLAGDLHHYGRRLADIATPAHPGSKKRSALVTCGTSGAFMHTTHGREISAPVALDRSPAETTEPRSLGMRLRVGIPDGSEGLQGELTPFVDLFTYPSQSRSRWLALSLLPLSLFNPRFRHVAASGFFRQLWESNLAFALALGVLYAASAYVNSLVLGTVAAKGTWPSPWWSVFEPSPSWPLALATNVALVAGCVRLGWEGTWPSWGKLLAGLTHGLAHGMAVMLIYAGAIRVNTGPNPLAAGATTWLTVGIGGAIVGALIFGAYFTILNGVCGQLTNNASGAMAIEDYKGFLRCAVDESGLTLRMLACDRVPRRWQRPPAEDGPRYVADREPEWRVVDTITLES